MNPWSRLRLPFLGKSPLRPPGTPAPVAPQPADPIDLPYRAPLFLLRPPENPAVPFRFALPTLADPVSQLCTANQMEEATYLDWCAEMHIPPDRHRKFWEWCYILQVLRRAGMLASGRRLLGFGTGREPLPSVMTKYGAEVVATDAPQGVDDVQGWASTNQHAEAVRDLHHPAIVPEADFIARARFRSADMNDIPADLCDFDACWSSCCFEHLGSIAHGLDFVENSLQTLRPGGIAVHTTEFNLDSNDATVETLGLSLFRKRDFEGLIARLVAKGHEVWPLNTHPGFAEVDQIVDLPPYQRALPHLKIVVYETTVTSIGLVVRRAP